MKHWPRNYSVAYIDGVKIMHNSKHDETIFILPSAMNGVQFMDWKQLNLAELREFTRNQSRRA